MLSHKGLFFWIITIPLFTWPCDKGPKENAVNRIRYAEIQGEINPKIVVYEYETGKYTRPVLKRERSCEDLRKYIKSVHWNDQGQEGRKEKKK